MIPTYVSSGVNTPAPKKPLDPEFIDRELYDRIMAENNTAEVNRLKEIMVQYGLEIRD